MEASETTPKKGKLTWAERQARARKNRTKRTYTERMETRKKNHLQVRRNLDHTQVLIAPIQSEKSFAGLEQQRYSFRVHPEATKHQVREAVTSLFNVTVTGVATSTVKDKPKRRGAFKGVKSGYKKAVVQLKDGDTIQIFEGVH